MYRREYRPCTVERQQNAERYDAAVSASEKYRRHVDPTFVDPDGRNAVHLAILLAIRDASNNGNETVDEASSSALDHAVQAGCDVNALDRWGRRPMHYAAESGHLGCIRRLIHHGADPNAPTGPSNLQLPGSSSSCRSDVIGVSPLMAAARRGRVDAVRLLVKSGAKATITNSCGETALHYAAGCTAHPEECLGVLLDGGMKTPVSPNAQDSSGNTALMTAVRNKSSHAAVSAVQTLIDFGADVGVTDAEQRTVLHLAAQRNIPEVIEILCKNGIDVDAADQNGDTAYVTAIKYDSPGALQALIDAGCDRSSIDGLMGTSVGLAALKGHAKVIETLVRNGEDPDECAYFGKPPLMLAAFEGQVQVVDTLLRLGADPNVRSRTGGSSLVAAIMRIEPKNEVEKHSVVKNLIRFGVDVNRGNRNEGHQTAGKNYFREACGSTPGREWALSYAIDSGYISLVHILLAAGSRLPPGEVIDRDTTTSARFFDMDELLKPVIEACSRPVSLQQLCRATVLRAISSRCRAISLQFQNSDRPSPRNIDDAIAALPIASRYRRYLSFDELEGIKIQRARVLDGASAGMFHMEESMPCGLRAVEGGLNVQQAPKHAVST